MVQPDAVMWEPGWEEDFGVSQCLAVTASVAEDEQVCGPGTSQRAAREGGQVCHWLHWAGNLERFGSEVWHGGRMIPLLRVSLTGWHPLPLVCDGCSQILPDLDLLGTKSAV